jgi:hypothetical protein
MEWPPSEPGNNPPKYFINSGHDFITKFGLLILPRLVTKLTAIIPEGGAATEGAKSTSLNSTSPLFGMIYIFKWLI